MKTNYFVISIISAILILAINQTVNAQSDNFKTYTNKDMKFSIQHPSNWKPEESHHEDHDSVYFQIRKNPEDKTEISDIFPSITSSYFRVEVQKLKPHLDSDTMTLQNMSIEEIAKNFINFMPDNSQTLIRQNYVTVGGNDGLKVEYMDTSSTLERYAFRIFTNAIGNLYTLQYQDKPLKVPETLPLINKMVESFQVNTADEDTSNTTLVYHVVLPHNE
jgi:PsbP-like protein